MPSLKKQGKFSSRRLDKINRGVSHKIKKPKIVKEKVSFRSLLQKVKSSTILPIPSPSNRSPLKSSRKNLKRTLSSPGISLLESPDANEDVENKKFFTTRSKATAVIALNKGITLFAKDGNVHLNTRKGLEKKNIGVQIENELTKEIKTKKLSDPKKVAERLELLVNTNASLSRPKPSRFCATPSPKKGCKRIDKSKNSSPRRSPRKNVLQETLSPKRIKEISANSPLKSHLRTVNSMHSSPSNKNSLTRIEELKSSSPLQPPRKNLLQKTLSPKRTKEISENSPLKLSSPLKTKNFMHYSPNKSSKIEDLKNSSPRRSPRRNLLQETLSPKSAKENSLISQSPLKLKYSGVQSPMAKLTPISKAIDKIHIGERSPRRSPRRKNKENFDEIETAFSNEENDILCSLLTDDDNEMLESSATLEATVICQTNEAKIKRSPKKKPLTENVKYFSIFTSNKASIKSPAKLSNSSRSKRLFPKESDPKQLVLDAGQKAFGATQCASCGAVYEIGDPQDENLHQSYHNRLFNVLKYSGWKDENQVTDMDFRGGRIIMVSPNSQQRHWKKVEEVLEHVDKELGFSDCGLKRKANTAVFLYILKNNILGCLIAEEVSQAYKVLQKVNSSKSVEGSDKLICCADVPQKVFAGVSRIWVLATERRKGIATALLDAMRSNFIPYHFLTVTEFAFSDPTQIGLNFAENYCKNPEFLVYRRNL